MRGGLDDRDILEGAARTRQRAHDPEALTPIGIQRSRSPTPRPPSAQKAAPLLAQLHRRRTERRPQDGDRRYGSQAPHMKMSIAAKSRSGHVWIEMWLSASTTTPDTPPSGEKWWKWLCRIVAPAASAASRNARSIWSGSHKLRRPRDPPGDASRRISGRPSRRNSPSAPRRRRRPSPGSRSDHPRPSPVG